MRAGLAGGAGLRCCHTAMTGGPASAARMAIPASGQPAEGAAAAGDDGDGQARADQHARPGRDHRAAQRQPRHLPQRSAPGAQDGQLALAARDEHPRREQDHRRADHDQADEQEQEHGFDGRLGAEEQGQVLQQRRG